MSFLGERNAIALGVSQHAVLGSGPLFTQLAPSLLLQFAGAETLDSRITFTRTTTATFTGSNGLIQSAAINAPRFDYNPTTLAPLGLLIEEQRTNIALQSANFNTGFWGLTNASLTTGIIDPAGGTSAVTFTATSANGLIQQPQSGTAGAAYSASFWIKRKTGTGQVSLRCGDTTLIPITVTSSWVRYSVTAVTSTTTVRIAVVLAASGDAVDIAFAQLEAGAFATSYIPTVASQATRAPDNASMTGTNFSSWYNATEGSFITDSLVAYVDAGKYPAVFQVTDGTLGNRIDQGYTPTPNPTNLAISLFVNTGGVNQAAAYPTVTRGAPLKLGAAYKVNSFAGVANGGSVGTDSSGTVPVCTQATIGTVATSGVYINGTIRQIVYYPRRLTNAQLQGLTR